MKPQTQLRNILDVNMFPPEKFRFHEVIEEMITYHLYGIVTEKGISYLTKTYLPNLKVLTVGDFKVSQG